MSLSIFYTLTPLEGKTTSYINQNLYRCSRLPQSLTGQSIPAAFAFLLC